MADFAAVSASVVVTTEDYASRGEVPTRFGENLESVCVREFDAEWNITYVNDAHCQLYGCESHELIGRKAWSLIDGSLAQEEQRRFLNSLCQERRRPTPFFCTERLSDGSSLPIRIDWGYRHDHAGAVVGFIWWLERLKSGECQELPQGGLLYGELLDVLHDGVGLVHRNGSFTYVNQRLCEILGLDKQALVGRSIFALGDRVGQKVLASARKAGEGGQFDRCEVTHRHPDGKRMCLSVSGKLLGPKTNEPEDVAGLLIVSDVTDRWRAETMRRRQAQIFDELHDAVLVLDMDRVVIDCSASAERLFGYKKSELIGRRAQTLQSPRADSSIEPEIAEALAEHGRWSGEVLICHPIGLDRICDVTIGSVRDDSGQVVGYLGVNRDITERKATERALSESEERYRQLIELQSDSLIVHDETGKIVFANDAAVEFYRAETLESLMRNNWLDLVPPERRASAVRRAEAVRELGYSPPDSESLRRRLDGSQIAVEMSARRVSWDGRPAVMSVARDITARKRAEDALRDSEARFRNLVGVSIQGYAIIATDWSLLYCNDAIAQIFGFSGAGPMIAFGPVRGFFAKTHLERIANAAEMVLNGEGPCSLELQGQRQDGSSIWLSAAIGLVEWQGARAIQAAVVDITQRKEAEIALKTSEAKLRLITDALPVFVSYIDREARFQFNNKAYEDWFGIPREQLRGTHMRDVLGDLAYRRIRPWLDSGLAGHTTTFEMRTHSASRRYIRGTFVPDFDETGAVRGVVGQVSDISERKSAEDSLRLQAALLENMAEGVGLVNPHDGAIIYANPKLERMLAYEQGELLGVNIRRLAQQGKAQQFVPIVAALEGSGAWSGEIECESKSGASLWCRGMFTTFDHLDHGVVWVGVFADISEQKRAHEALRHAKEEAVRANFAKSRFLASASHDLRQPLQASNLFLAALADVQSKAEREQIIGDLGMALSSMGSLLNALLEISKLEAQVVHPQVTDFNLRGTMSRLAKEFGAQAKEKGLELRLVSSGATVRSDPSMLSRILGNYLANAVQHTDQGKILFGCRRVGAFMRVEVWDTGRGVPDDAKESIFEEFYQHGLSRRDRNAGLGLGLAIVQRTAELLDHTIHMHSVFEKGSMFAVDVPLGSAVREAEEADRWSMVVSGDVAGTTMIVLEDDPSVRKATAYLLARWGVEVIATETSDEAIAEVARLGVRPDLLIADYQLVDETGITAAERIEASCGHDIPTIVITGDPTEERMAEITRSGARAMCKPANPAELRLVIRDLSQRRG